MILLALIICLNITNSTANNNLNDSKIKLVSDQEVLRKGKLFLNRYWLAVEETDYDEFKKRIFKRRYYSV